MNKETGEVLNRGEMLRQFDKDYEEVYEGKNICLITREEADRIIETKRPTGLFYQQIDTYLYLGIHIAPNEAFVEEFSSKEDCFDWLIGKEKKDEITD